MKKIVFALALLCGAAFTAAAQAPQPATSIVTPGTAPAPKIDKNAPRFQFAGGEVHDFGNLSDQRDAEYTFQFRNTGKTPLVIEGASASCGCTVPEYPKEPILAGKTGQIKVTFRTAGKSGPFDKTVSIKSNAPSNVGGDHYEIHIKGAVMPGAQVGNNMTTPKG